jgi:hypothetical protein
MDMEDAEGKAGASRRTPHGEASEKESGSILEMVSAITREVPEREWERVPADLSKNVDHYLYGSKRTDQ